jgi:5-methyltetrahydrofolate--homocysteine methyltransferase
VNKLLNIKIRQKILVLDGAMGTMIQRHKLKEEDFRGKLFGDHEKYQKGNNDLLSLTNPGIIRSIHRAYLEAGADLITTNTFNSNRISMADYGMEDQVYNMNVAGARIAVEAINEFEGDNKDRRHFVVGTLGPTNRAASMSPEVNDPGARSVRHIPNRQQDSLKVALIFLWWRLFLMF